MKHAKHPSRWPRALLYGNNAIGSRSVPTDEASGERNLRPFSERQIFVLWFSAVLSHFLAVPLTYVSQAISDNNLCISNMRGYGVLFRTWKTFPFLKEKESAFLFGWIYQGSSKVPCRQAPVKRFVTVTVCFKVFFALFLGASMGCLVAAALWVCAHCENPPLLSLCPLPLPWSSLVGYYAS